MISYRVIARLDIKGANVVKGIAFEGLRVMGSPVEMAAQYAEDADEIIYLDTVASLYGRNHLEPILEETTDKVFIPVTVGGGIKSVADVQRVLNCGADKVAINTAAIQNPALISEITGRYGSQALVVNVEAKRVNGGWEAYADNGRTRTGRDVLQWIDEAVDLGAGEILLTSVDMDGTRRGPDQALIEAVQTPVPVIYSGGCRLPDLWKISQYTQGVAIGAALHYKDTTIREVKDELRKFKEIR